MANGLGQQIQLDLVQIRNSAARSELSQDVQPAMQIGSSEPTQGFGDILKAAVRSADDKERVAGDKMAAVDSGKSDDLVGAMLSSQEASLQFSMLMQVRNKVVGAMDDLIKMQL